MMAVHAPSGCCCWDAHSMSAYMFLLTFTMHSQLRLQGGFYVGSVPPERLEAINKHTSNANLKACLCDHGVFWCLYFTLILYRALEGVGYFTILYRAFEGVG